MSFSIAILTGGKSTRMGSDKASIYVNGKRILEHLVALASSVSDDVMIAGNHPIESNNIRTIPDLEKEKGPLAGMQSVLSNSKHEWTLFIPCDLLLFNQNSLDWIAKQFDSLVNSSIAITQTRERDQYLIGYYNRSLLPLVSDCLANDRLRVRDLIKAVEVQKIRIPEDLEICLTNMNSPADLNTFGWTKLKVLAFGQAGEIIKSDQLDWITKCSNSKELKTEFNKAFNELSTISFRLALNESLTNEHTPLSMNDTIAILPPFAGG